MEEDKEILQKLYQRNKQKLYYMAWKIIRDDMLAEEAIHMCFLKLIEHFEKYREQSYENLEKLCGAIVINSARDIAREYARKEPLEQEQSGLKEELVRDYMPDVLQQIIEQDEQKLIVEALRRLEPEEYHFLYLQYGLGIKPKEIGKLMNVPSSVVRKKMLKCRKKLAKILEDDRYETLQNR